MFVYISWYDVFAVNMTLFANVFVCYVYINDYIDAFQKIDMDRIQIDIDIDRL